MLLPKEAAVDELYLAIGFENISTRPNRIGIGVTKGRQWKAELTAMPPRLKATQAV